jgi:hypothetical protein
MRDTRTEYRGYRIYTFGSGSSWSFSASPITPFLPILPWGVFASSATTEVLAIEEAKERIDRLLAS